MTCPQCGRESAVRETRAVERGIVVRRRRECTHCGHRFNTFEIYEECWGSIKRWSLDSHVKAVGKRWALTRRNEKILAMLAQGHKHAFVAAQFGLSDNMISTIARRNGIPAYRRTKESNAANAANATNEAAAPRSKDILAVHARQSPRS